jgi:hypothetical protein
MCKGSGKRLSYQGIHFEAKERTDQIAVIVSVEKPRINPPSKG